MHMRNRQRLALTMGSVSHCQRHRQLLQINSRRCQSKSNTVNKLYWFAPPNGNVRRVEKPLLAISKFSSGRIVVRPKLTNPPELHQSLHLSIRPVHGRCCLDRPLKQPVRWSICPRIGPLVNLTLIRFLLQCGHHVAPFFFLL